MYIHKHMRKYYAFVDKKNHMIMMTDPCKGFAMNYFQFYLLDSAYQWNYFMSRHSYAYGDISERGTMF
jgi:hypothetical protein